MSVTALLALLALPLAVAAGVAAIAYWLGLDTRYRRRSARPPRSAPNRKRSAAPRP